MSRGRMRLQEDCGWRETEASAVMIQFHMVGPLVITWLKGPFNNLVISIIAGSYPTCNPRAIAGETGAHLAVNPLQPEDFRVHPVASAASAPLIGHQP